MDLLTRDVTRMGRIEPTANDRFRGDATWVSGRESAYLTWGFHIRYRQYRVRGQCAAP